jgi:hypothetical protein
VFEIYSPIELDHLVVVEEARLRVVDVDGEVLGKYPYSVQNPYQFMGRSQLAGPRVIALTLL